MAADVVSAASPHYGQVRVYAKPREIAQLQLSGYSNSRLLDALTVDRPLLASVNGSHMMHNFLGVAGDNRPDVSDIRDASSPSRARDNIPIKSEYSTAVAN